ncbi:MAG: ATP-binding cassette domain-containing protein [Magnetospirillum sp. WYHS-4]
MTETLIEASGVSVDFEGRPILKDVSTRVREREIVALIGPNGAGKTTLVRAMLGLLAPDAGSVRRRTGLRVGYMPQRLSLDPALPLTVKRFLELAVPRGRDATLARLQMALDEVGAGHVLETPLQGASGGEMQRILLARALLREPDLLVLDEPVQGVDVTGQAELHRLIAAIRDRRGVGILMVSHDLHLVMAATDTVVCLNGHVCCAGHPESVSAHPEYLALFGAVAIYQHHHDHRHDEDGQVIPIEEASHG